MTPRILVATLGRVGSDAALRAAAAIAAAHGATVDVLTVLEPLPIFDAGFVPTVIPYEDIERQRRDELLARVRAQVEEIAGAANGWKIALRIGSPAHAIVDAARQPHTLLVVLGIGRHEPADRIFGNETAIRVSRLSSVPVLAVAPGHGALPSRVIAATDFSPSSLRAARAAASLVAPSGTLTLAHVAPTLEADATLAESWEGRYAESVAIAFERLRRDIDVQPGVCVETVVLRGDAAVELLALARRTNAGLIAVGSHGFNFAERMLVGSVAAKLLRTARCSVMVAPADRALRARHAEGLGTVEEQMAAVMAVRSTPPRPAIPAH
ncbi:MAG TPA: universal stress protein [Gemmatimonadaceae bacterium]